MPINIQGAIDAIVSDEFPEWTILLGIGAYNEANLIDETGFYDLQIDEQLNSIPTASLTFVNHTEDELQDVAIRIYKDGKKRFTGVIKRCSNTYLSNELSCECLGIAFQVQRYNIKNIQDFKNTKSSEIINKWLNPNDPENIRDEGWIDEDVGWKLEIDTINDFLIDYRLESGNFLNHINEICNLNFWEWWVEEDDSTDGISQRKFMIKSRRGLETPSITFSQESTAYNAIIDKDKDKLINAVLVSGSSSQVSNTSTTAAGFFHMGDEETPTAMGYVIGSESVLAKPVITGDTKLVLESTSGYVTPGIYTVKIDDEELEYDTVDETTLTLVEGTHATDPHEPGTPVLMISLMRAYIPPSVIDGSQLVWIGNELIRYGSVDYWGIHDLERGQTYNDKGTPVYAHGDGTKVLGGGNSLNVPNENSSIGMWGQSDNKISNSGSTNRDGLDKYGMSVILNAQKFEPFGTFQCSLDEIKDLKPGDAFYIKEHTSSETIIKRCTGLFFDGDIVTISFGLNENYILNQFESIIKVDNTTYAKQDLDDSIIVKHVSPDGSSISYYDKNNNERWVALR